MVIRLRACNERLFEVAYLLEISGLLFQPAESMESAAMTSVPSSGAEEMAIVADKPAIGSLPYPGTCLSQTRVLKDNDGRAIFGCAVKATASPITVIMPVMSPKRIFEAEKNPKSVHRPIAMVKINLRTET